MRNTLNFRQSPRSPVGPNTASTLSLVLRITGAVLLILTSLVVLLALVISYIASRRATVPPRIIELHDLADFDFAAIAREVTFPARDGTMLRGWFVPATRRGGATVVLLHGYGNSRFQLLPHADYLHRDGYNVFLIDMRGRGASGGNAVTLGAHEPFDALGAVDYVVTRPDVDPGRIALQGVSLGAAVAILAAADDDRVRAVVAESAFTDILGAVGCSFEHFIRLPATPFANIALCMTEWRLRARADHVRPIDAIQRLHHCPVFLIDDELDERIPPHCGKRLYDAAPGPKALWSVGGAGHTEAFARFPAEYQRRVLRFYQCYLSPSLR